MPKQTKTTPDWQKFFTNMAFFHPQFIDMGTTTQMSKHPLGTSFWEELYKAFKSRMEAERE